MCCHRLFIFSTCGHSTFAREPLVLCQHAAIAPDAVHSSLCELIAHPYQSWKFDQLCPPCQQRRDSMLGRIEKSQTIIFDETLWKVSYHRSDYWIKKAEARKAEEERLKAEQKKRSKRWSLRKSKGMASSKSPRETTAA